MEFGNFEHTCDGEDEHKRRRSELDRLKAAMTNSTVLTRHEFVKRGEKLEYFTIAWNSLEALVSIVAGVFAGSVSLVGFGLDSLIEVTSGAALLWRLHHDIDPSQREDIERKTLRVVGVCFVALAVYIN